MLSPLLALVLAAALTDRGVAPESIESPRGTRVEAFSLERPTPEGPEPIAVVLLRRLDGEAGALLEQEVHFREGGVRIFHAETFASDGWSFVRRELRGPASPGRSSSGEPDGSGGLRLLRWGVSLPVHETWPAPAPRLPLEFLESLRFEPEPDLEPEPAGAVPLYDPLAEAVIEVDVRVVPGDPREKTESGEGPGPPDRGATRTFELRRPDRSLVGRYVYRAGELVAFQWQDGPRWAHRIDPAEARRRAKEWRQDLDPLAEVWSAVRAGQVRRR